MSLEQTVPKADTLARAANPSQHARLAQGRITYITKCAKCHQPEPVLKYSRAEWDRILEEMIPETNLAQEEISPLRSYIFAVLES